MKKLLLILLCAPLIFSCGEEEEKKDKGLSACDCADYAMEVFKFREKGEIELRDKIEKNNDGTQLKEIEGSYRTGRQGLLLDINKLKRSLEKEFTICKDLSDESQDFYEEIDDCFLDKINKFSKLEGDLDSLVRGGILVKYKNPDRILDSYLEIIEKRKKSPHSETKIDTREKTYDAVKYDTVNR